MKMQVVLDDKKCCGYTSCVVAAPEVFDFDDPTNVAKVLDGHPGEERRAQVLEAVRSCPVGAITLIED
jgi:ferredoxin